MVPAGKANNLRSVVEIPGNEKLGVYFICLLVYLFMEFGRPSNPMRIPMVIAVILFVGWLLHPTKKWNLQVTCFLLFLGVMALHIPFADNTYTALWTTYLMVTTLAFTCLPLMHFVNSLRKLRLFILTFVAVFAYVGLWAIFHSGFGPAGAAGGQDENYVGLMMAMMIPFCFFSLFVETGWLKRLFLASAAVVGILATVVGFSRGGFLGLAAIFVYCVMKSPKKFFGVTIGLILAVGVVQYTSDEYWQEIHTITDTHEATADMRLELWATAYRMFLDNPILGVGPGNFLWRVAEYQTEEQYAKFGRSLDGSVVTHSLYFELIAELGLTGALLIGLILYQSYQDLRFVEKETKTQLALLALKARGGTTRANFLRGDWILILTYRRAIMASSIGSLVCSVFLSTLYMSYVWLVCSMAVALRGIVSEELGQVEHPTVEGVRRERN